MTSPMTTAVSPSQLTRRYVAALLSTVVALLLAQIVIQPELSRQHRRLEAVNQVGRQRLLANEVSELMILCRVPGQSNCAGPIEQAAENLRRGHEAAVADARSLLHFDSTPMDTAMALVIATVQTAVAQPDEARVEAARAACSDYASVVDETLTRASVLLIQRVWKTRLIAGGFFAAVVLLIVLQALFVFRPAVRSITNQLAVVTRARDELQASLDHVKMLQGLLPICMHCKRIRDDEQNWQRIETYLHQHADVNFTHSICSECLEKYHSEPG